MSCPQIALGTMVGLHMAMQVPALSTLPRPWGVEHATGMAGVTPCPPRVLCLLPLLPVLQCQSCAVTSLTCGQFKNFRSFNQTFLWQ